MKRLWLGLVALAACEAPSKTPPPGPGELIGRIEISEDVPASGCRVLMEGAPLGAACDESGEFDIKRVPAGRWNLRLVTDGAPTALPTRRVAAGANPGQVTDLGALRLAKPGAVGGHLMKGSSTELATAIITVPELGTVTAPNDNGGYLLEGVSPGRHDVVLLLDQGQMIHANVTVLPGGVTTGVDFDVSSAKPAMVSINGHAARQDGTTKGLTVELVEALDGKIIANVPASADGSFTMAAQHGTYVVRVRDGKSPVTALLPSVVVRGDVDLALPTQLVVPPLDGDLDGDGIANSKDGDIDGDGFENAKDAFPYDPAEWLDTDGDGIGDRSDLRSKGGASIDVKNPTPDSDGDGLLDFEDNCPKKANKDQKDSDGDGVGDACDDCPFVADPDQKDSVGNGTGDACRTCRTNQDCPGGALCEFGQCLACANNRQCGDEHCDPVKHQCVPCASSADCTAPDKCDTTIGRCVACLANSDCPTGQACNRGQCFPQCTSDANCAGAFCVSGACVLCRGNGDCPSNQWCDAGTCRPQCTVNGDCSGGRTCDAATHTCVLPCSGVCLMGEACTSGTCRAVCDGSRPCATGFKCASGSCVPECAVDGDCASVRPLTVCKLGQCVPSGACAVDTDCPRAQMCVSGTCASRPSASTANGFLCDETSCDCRMDEACLPNSDGHRYCAVERAPTWFVGEVACPANCDGKTPQTFFSDLQVAVDAAKEGDLIAARSPITNGVFGGTPDPIPTPLPYTVTITKNNLELTGGYRICAQNRWVRDPSAASTVMSSTAPMISIPGTSGAPVSGVTVRNLQLREKLATGTFKIISASFAPGLTLANHYVTPTAGGSFTAISCTNCTNVNFSNVYVSGVNSGADDTLVSLPQGSGTIDQIHGGYFTGVNTISGVMVSNTVGPVTITNTTIDGADTARGRAGVWVDGGGGGLVTIKGSMLSAATINTNDSGFYYGVYIKSAPAFVADNNTVNGVGLTDTQQASGRDYFRFEDSNGTAKNNAVVWPTLASQNTVGFHIKGPRGAVTLDNSSTSGGGGTASYAYYVWIDGVTSGTTRVTHGNFTGNMYANQALPSVAGVFASGTFPGGFVVSDTTIRLADTVTNNPIAIYAVSSAGLVERCKLFAAVGGDEHGIYASASQLEIYDSYVYAGRATYSASHALEAYSSSSLYAVGNTLDGGGVPNDGKTSSSLGCDGGSTAIMTSNLISGGYSTLHKMLDGNACVSAANFHNNYFWYSALGPESAGDGARTAGTGAGSTPDANGNIVADTVGCYDGSYSQPDYHLAAGSPCIDKGAAALSRKDTSAITVDIDNAARKLGAATDVGCSEKQ